MTTESTAMPKAVEDCHALLGWIIPQVDRFPRARRFTLGERIESGLLLVLERLVEAEGRISQWCAQGLVEQQPTEPAFGKPQQEQAE